MSLEVAGPGLAGEDGAGCSALRRDSKYVWPVEDGAFTVICPPQPEWPAPFSAHLGDLIRRLSDLP